MKPWRGHVDRTLTPAYRSKSCCQTRSIGATVEPQIIFGKYRRSGGNRGGRMFEQTAGLGRLPVTRNPKTTLFTDDCDLENPNGRGSRPLHFWHSFGKASHGREDVRPYAHRAQCTILTVTCAAFSSRKDPAWVTQAFPPAPVHGKFRKIPL
jgi:hypothetical protein